MPLRPCSSGKGLGRVCGRFQVQAPMGIQEDLGLCFNSNFRIHYEHKDLDKQWHCPWGSTVVDDVTPAFKTILEENYLSSSTFPLDDTKENRLQWWTQRKKLDHRLGKLLR